MKPWSVIFHHNKMVTWDCTPGVAGAEDPREFDAELLWIEREGYHGRSSWWLFRDVSTGRYYYFSDTQFTKILPFMDRGRLSGRFNFKRVGGNYVTCVMLRDVSGASVT